MAIVLSTGFATRAADVRVWQEPLEIPTYRVGPPDPCPRFYAGRTHQGAQGRVYPYAMLDVLTGGKETRAYTALYLENEYVKLCVLPELGGRLFSARDKTNGYDFFYRQSVIKPVLIGMLGAYPPGSLVRLSDETLAVTVDGPRGPDIFLPVVKQWREDDRLDLSAMPGLSITSCLDPAGLELSEEDLHSHLLPMT